MNIFNLLGTLHYGFREFSLETFGILYPIIQLNFRQNFSQRILYLCNGVKSTLEYVTVKINHKYEKKLRCQPSRYQVE